MYCNIMQPNNVETSTKQCYYLILPHFKNIIIRASFKVAECFIFVSITNFQLIIIHKDSN